MLKTQCRWPLRALPVVCTLLLANVGAAGAADSSLGGPCRDALRFDRKNFDKHSADIDNKYMPLVPGTQLVFEGFITPQGGPSVPVEHQVIFTVTDLTKVIGGVRTRVVYDVDLEVGEVVEAELAFFAQDEDGNVWSLGEYPEEYEEGEFAGAPFTWINGLNDARGGLAMFGSPRRGKPSYLQGLAPDIDFYDCGQVIAKDLEINGYDDVLQIAEWSPLDPDSGIQVKYFAPGVGNVQIAALGDPEAETLILTDVVELNRRDLKDIRVEAFAQDRRAYHVSDVYRETEKAERDDD